MGRVIILGLSILLPCVGAFAQIPDAIAFPAHTSASVNVSDDPTAAYTLSPEKLAKAKALYDLGGKLRIIGAVWSFLVLLGILSLCVAARYRNWAEKATSNSFAQCLIVVVLLLMTINVLHWPLAIYSQKISLEYGLSVQSWSSWFSDVLKGEALFIAIFCVAFWGAVQLIRKSPTRWWLYLWLLALPIGAFFVILTPWVIDPLFNTFEPLAKKNPQLVDAIERITARGGLAIPRGRMLAMKASAKVTTLNAYVNGFGPSKRVVVWDTTIQKASTPETLFIFGHEMGHYVLNHVVYRQGLSALGLLILMYLIYKVAGWLLPRAGQRSGIRGLDDWAVLPLLLLIYSVFNLVATPISNTFYRQLEHNADVYGLEVTHGINANAQETAAHAFQRLGELSYAYPYPNKLLVFWYYDHPPIADRVRFAREYDPWDKGEQPKYVK